MFLGVCLLGHASAHAAAKDIEAGAGRCLYCSSNALVTHSHALECAFDKISAGASVEFVDRLRKMRHLEMLRSTKVQGLTYPAPLRGWGSPDHPTHQATAQALKIEDCYSISAQHRSAVLAYEVLIRRYNEKQRRRSTKKSLQKRIAKDSKVALPVSVKVNRAEKADKKGNVKPDKPQQAGLIKPKVIMEVDGKVTSLGPFDVHTKQLRMIQWVLGANEQSIDKIMTAHLAKSSVQCAEQPSLLFQEALLRWVLQNTKYMPTALM